MKKTGKIVLGLATFWPIVYVFAFSTFFIVNLLLIITKRIPGNPIFFSSYVWLFVLHLITMLWMITLLVIYIVNLFNNDRVEQDKKALWAVVLFFGNMIAMPIYWYLYIWREPKVAQQPR